MKKSRFNDGSVQNIIKIAFFVLGAVAILQSFPREGRFRYTFQEGKPWRYGLMTAPYDFQIYKNDKQLEEERRLALQDFKPYILLDSSSFKKNLALFKADYHNKYRFTLPSHYYEYLTSWLSNVYASGIIGKKDKDKLLNDSVRFVTIVSNKIAHSQSISTLLTASEAYESLYSSLPSTINPFLLKTCNLNNYLSENLQIDERNTKQARDAMLETVSLTSGMVQRGERIVDRGEIISPEAFRILSSLKKVAETRREASGGTGVLLGQVLLVCSLFVLQFLFLWLFRPFTYKRKSNVAFIMILVTGMVLLTSLIVRSGFLNVYIIPYMILPIMVRTFFDSRTALFAHIITVLICSSIVSYPYEFLLLQITAGMATVYSLKDLTQRSQLVFCALLVFVTYCVMYLGVSLIQEGAITRIQPLMLAYFLLNAGLILSSYLLIYLFEWIFGYTSNVTLVELSNINNPLLRLFSETCLERSNIPCRYQKPGTAKKQKSTCQCSAGQDRIFIP